MNNGTPQSSTSSEVQAPEFQSPKIGIYLNPPNACVCYQKNVHSQMFYLSTDPDYFETYQYGTIGPRQIFSWLIVKTDSPNSNVKWRTCDYSSTIVRMWAYRLDDDTPEMRVELATQERKFIDYAACVEKMGDNDSADVYADAF
jgi:hypothetical protein